MRPIRSKHQIQLDNTNKLHEGKHTEAYNRAKELNKLKAEANRAMHQLFNKKEEVKRLHQKIQTNEFSDSQEGLESDSIAVVKKGYNLEVGKLGKSISNKSLSQDKRLAVISAALDEIINNDNYGHEKKVAILRGITPASKAFITFIDDEIAKNTVVVLNELKSKLRILAEEEPHKNISRNIEDLLELKNREDFVSKILRDLNASRLDYALEQLPKLENWQMAKVQKSAQNLVYKLEKIIADEKESHSQEQSNEEDKLTIVLAETAKKFNPIPQLKQRLLILNPDFQTSFKKKFTGEYKEYFGAAVVDNFYKNGKVEITNISNNSKYSYWSSIGYEDKKLFLKAIEKEITFAKNTLEKEIKIIIPRVEQLAKDNIANKDLEKKVLELKAELNPNKSGLLLNQETQEWEKGVKVADLTEHRLENEKQKIQKDISEFGFDEKIKYLESEIKKAADKKNTLQEEEKTLEIKKLWQSLRKISDKKEELQELGYDKLETLLGDLLKTEDKNPKLVQEFYRDKNFTLVLPVSTHEEELKFLHATQKSAEEAVGLLDQAIANSNKSETKPKAKEILETIEEEVNKVDKAIKNFTGNGMQDDVNLAEALNVGVNNLLEKQQEHKVTTVGESLIGEVVQEDAKEVSEEVMSELTRESKAKQQAVAKLKLLHEQLAELKNNGSTIDHATLWEESSDFSGVFNSVRNLKNFDEEKLNLELPNSFSSRAEFFTAIPGAVDKVLILLGEKKSEFETNVDNDKLNLVRTDIGDEAVFIKEVAEEKPKVTLTTEHIHKYDILPIDKTALLTIQSAKINIDSSEKEGAATQNITPSTETDPNDKNQVGVGVKTESNTENPEPTSPRNQEAKNRTISKIKVIAYDVSDGDSGGKIKKVSPVIEGLAETTKFNYSTSNPEQENGVFDSSTSEFKTIKDQITELLNHAKEKTNKEFTDQITNEEVGLAIMLAIKHGGLSKVNNELLRDDLRNTGVFKESVSEDELYETYKKMAAFSWHFQNIATTQGLFTGNEKEIAEVKDTIDITGLRLKRLTPNYSREFFTMDKDGLENQIDKWEKACEKIGLTPETLAKPTPAVEKPEAHKIENRSRSDSVSSIDGTADIAEWSSLNDSSRRYNSSRSSKSNRSNDGSFSL